MQRLGGQRYSFNHETREIPALGLDHSEIEPSDSLVFDLGVESSQSVESVTAFEAEFDIDMDQEQALAVQTVEGAADFIAKHLNK